MKVYLRTFPRVVDIDSNRFDSELDGLLDKLVVTKVEDTCSQPSVNGTQTTNAHFLEIKLPDEAGDGSEKKMGNSFSKSGGKTGNFRKSIL